MPTKGVRRLAAIAFAAAVAGLGGPASAEPPPLRSVPAVAAPRRDLRGTAQPPGEVRAGLVGTWRCPDTWMIELSGGRGPTALKLKDDGVYVVVAKPKGKKLEFREYGHWTADDANVWMDTEWFQAGHGKLEPEKGKGRYFPSPYALEPSGALTFRGERFAKVGGPAPGPRGAEGPAGGGAAPATGAKAAGPLDVNDLAVVFHRAGVLHVLYPRHFAGQGGKATYTVRWKSGDGDAAFSAAADRVVTVTAAGKRTVTPGYYLESVSPDGRLVYLSKPNDGVWAMAFPSGRPRRLSAEPLGWVRPSPTGAYLTGQTGWQERHGTWYAGQNDETVVLTAAGKRVGTMKGSPTTWLAHDTRLVVYRHGGPSGEAEDSLVDVTAGLPVLCAGLRNTFWFPSDNQQWWFGQGQPPNQVTFVRVADGRRFDHALPPGDYIGHQWSVGDRYVRLGFVNGVLVAPDRPGEAVAEGGAFLPLGGGPRAPSPDGKLLAVFDRNEIQVLDAENPGRAFRTGVKLPGLSALAWVAPHVLRYEGRTTGLITFGKKAAALAPGAPASGGLPRWALGYAGGVEAPRGRP